MGHVLLNVLLEGTKLYEQLVALGFATLILKVPLLIHNLRVASKRFTNPILFSYSNKLLSLITA